MSAVFLDESSRRWRESAFFIFWEPFTVFMLTGLLGQLLPWLASLLHDEVAELNWYVAC